MSTQLQLAGWRGVRVLCPLPLLQEGAAIGALPALVQCLLRGTSSAPQLLLLLWKCPDRSGTGVTCLELTPES